MRESLNRVHVHELPPEELPRAANDNAESLPISHTAVNDNELPGVADTSNEVSARLLAQARANLGLETMSEDTLEKTEDEHLHSPEEIPQIAPEQIHELQKQLTAETASGETGTKSDSEPPARTAQAAGGASSNEGDSGSSGGDGSGSDTHGERGEKKPGGWGTKVLNGIGKVLKLALLAPVWIFGAVFALTMNGLVKTTNKAFDSAKLTKGGAKPSGGSKPSGGGHGGGGHH